MHPDKLSRGWNPHEGNNAACLRVGICEKNWPGQPAKKNSPAVLRYSQKCPESLDGFLSQTTKFLINPFTRRCTLTNYQGGGSPMKAIMNLVGWDRKPSRDWPFQAVPRRTAGLSSGTACPVQNSGWLHKSQTTKFLINPFTRNKLMHPDNLSRVHLLVKGLMQEF